eukprot:274503_1
MMEIDQQPDVVALIKKLVESVLKNSGCLLPDADVDRATKFAEMVLSSRISPSSLSDSFAIGEMIKKKLIEQSSSSSQTLERARRFEELCERLKRQSALQDPGPIMSLLQILMDQSDTSFQKAPNINVRPLPSLPQFRSQKPPQHSQSMRSSASGSLMTEPVSARSATLTD